MKPRSKITLASKIYGNRETVIINKKISEGEEASLYLIEIGNNLQVLKEFKNPSQSKKDILLKLMHRLRAYSGSFSEIPKMTLDHEYRTNNEMMDKMKFVWPLDIVDIDYGKARKKMGSQGNIPGFGYIMEFVDPSRFKPLSIFYRQMQNQSDSPNYDYDDEEEHDVPSLSTRIKICIYLAISIKYLEESFQSAALCK